MSPNQPKPSVGEMELLSLLWQNGAMTLSDVHDAMGRSVGYTTVQTRLNRLVDKGLATKMKAGRGATQYSASVDRDEVSASQLDVLVERVTNGSVVPLVAQLLDGTRLSTEDMQELRQLVRQAEERSRKEESDR